MPPATIRLSILLLGCLAALVAAAGWLRHRAEPDFTTSSKPVSQSGVASVGGPFALTDSHGNRVTEAALIGHVTLIYFGYASCPDVCPTELQTIGAAFDMLAADGPEKNPSEQGFFITVDPARDTVAALADYMPNFHPKLTGLTGSAEEIAAAAKAYRVYFSKVAPEAGSESYLMDHSNIIYVMGPDGKFLAHFGFGASAELIAAKLREIQK